ncbi:single-stranded-DNA-specific exonuclease RecJ [Algivirga pacifica]|uniref:Single-stranded-DNA-specific exonuclease RecJ n=2 Tax=Algivirga pacifica TaxID=1162670 RepID=A0ABP9DAM7_9BACT
MPLLQSKGITVDTAETFLYGGMDRLHSPLLMKNMEKAVERLVQAIEEEERILFYGDYDVDGVSAVSMYIRFFKDVYPHYVYYLPDRYVEGYGLSELGVQFAKEHGCGLIVTFDCGTTAVKEVEMAQHMGIDVIICDHHQVTGDIPEAYALLNPKQAGCTYPFKELSGAGVGYKLLQAFCDYMEVPEDHLYEQLDLLVLSIACDIVPMKGENRILAREGLRQLRSTTKEGLIGLLKRVGKFQQSISISDLVFKIGPRLNAAGRMANATLSVSLLVTDEQQEVSDILIELEWLNQQRKVEQEAVEQEVFTLLKTAPDTRVFYNKNWHAAVLGIVASRCAEKVQEPVVLLTQKEEVIIGSARSANQINLYNILQTCEGTLQQFGGHAQAAGLQLAADHREVFEQCFMASLSIERVHQTDRLTAQSLLLDLELHLDEITLELYELLEVLRPWGPEHKQAVFFSRGLTVSGEVRILKERYMKFTVRQKGRLHRFEAVSYQANPDVLSFLKSGREFDMAYSIQAYHYGPHRYFQLKVKDIRSTERVG